MIPSSVKVYLASQSVDFRKGPEGLIGLVRDAGADPFNGSLYVFRAKRADRIKMGRDRPLPLRQAAGESGVLLAQDRQQPGPAEPCPTAVAGGGHGLETGARGAGEPFANGWVKACGRLTH
ncbi:IS66 family insertion sequence element accessory protein TnpB [Devosia sp. RR2S18]|nr:IS66 family insertion sequence element accessory protein TnpB [Devosia sp. RR2S18]WIJ24005.1 IS66 family insertion sequence element accessory protein TnpB [Devosia sp. RR2S18]